MNLPSAVPPLVAALLGLAVGSFLNVVIHRLPRGQSLVSPGSSCPACGRPIRARHNVPVLGWVLLRGRCADCGERISPRYPLVELGTGLLNRRRGKPQRVLNRGQFGGAALKSENACRRPTRRCLWGDPQG